MKMCLSYIAVFTALLVLNAETLAEDALVAASPVERFAAAQALRRDGLPDEALIELDALRSEYPDDVDYAFARAQVLADMGKVGEALTELDRSAELAPEYEDVWRLRLVIATQADVSDDELEARRAESAARFPDSLWWQRPEPETVWTMMSGFGVENLSNDAPGWDNQFVEIARERDGRIAVRVDRHSRFAGDDIALGASFDYPVGDDWRIGAYAATAADPAFLPDFDIGASAHRALEGGWGLSLGLRRREYPTASIDALNVGAEKYLGDFRLAWRLDLASLDGDSPSAGHGIVGSWYYAEGASLNLAFNTGEEAEAIGNGQVLETDVRGIAVSGRQPLTSRVTLQWWLGVHEQGDFYRRRYVGMAVSYRL